MKKAILSYLKFRLATLFWVTTTTAVSLGWYLDATGGFTAPQREWRAEDIKPMPVTASTDKAPR